MARLTRYSSQWFDNSKFGIFIHWFVFSPLFKYST